MKKSFLFAGLAVIAALAACNKSEIEVSENAKVGRPVSIFVSPADETKTVNDGLHTKWAEGDALAVFAAEAGATVYGDELQFTLKDAETNKFDGTADLTADAYDWYAFYPYDSHISTPANDAAGYVTLGSYHNNNQTQAGNNSTAHLAGKSFPLYGQVKNVAKADDVVIPMHQAASVVAVNVTNDTPAAITVSKIVFTATESIVGQYFINFVDAAATYTDRTGNVSNVATLVVNEGAEIAAGASATFYIGVKPFTAAAAAELTVKVNATNGEQEIVKAMEAETVFAAGHIKTLNVSYTKVAGAEIEGGWKLVEGADDLADGLEIIIANADANKAMGTTQNKNNRAAVALTASDSKKTAEVTADHQHVILEKTGDNWYLKVGEDQYLYAAGANSSNYLKTDTKDNVGDKGIFTITFETEGIPTVKAIDAGTSKNWLRYNSGNTIFSCYASGQEDIRFYYKEEAAAPKVLTIERLWGKYPNTGWPTDYVGAGEDRTIATDGEWIYIAKAGSSVSGIVAISVEDPTVFKNVNCEGVDGGLFKTSCVRTIWDPDTQKYILLASSLTTEAGHLLKIYAWKDGIDAAPTTLLSWEVGGYRRFGDFFTTTGTFKDGELWFRNNTDNTDHRCDLCARFTLKDGALTAQWPDAFSLGYNGSKGRGSLYFYEKGKADVLLVTDAIGMFFDVNNGPGGKEWTNGTDYSAWKNRFGFTPFEYNGQKFIAYQHMYNAARSWLTILNDTQGTSEGFMQTLIDNDIVFQAAVQIEKDEPSTDVVSGATYTDQTMANCSVAVMADHVIIVGHQHNTGLAVFKMYMK